jgi:DNA-directed RNA polymerase subunit K/omega
VSKYEYTRLMGARVLTLSQDASLRSTRVPHEGIEALLDTAQQEFEEAILPLRIARRLPSGNIQVRSAHQLHLMAHEMKPHSSSDPAQDALVTYFSILSMAL